jgi:exoribonuclease-2
VLREVARGKPENFNRPDYNFRLERDGEEAGTEPKGTERVSITTRQRGSPLDLIVAEAMILANSTWGGWIAECGVPGIYRSQASMAPGVKVRMGTKALPHAGIGVKSYAWSTSPLRRYTDLVNQWQILACAEHGVTAPLVAPFKHRDATLFAIVSSFDAAYAAYNEFQQNMERYWCLRWLGQENAKQVDAVVLKDEVLRLVDIPLVIRLPGMQQVARGAQVRLDIVRWDEVDLSLEARLLEVAAVAPSEELALEDEEEGADSGEAAAVEGAEAEGAVTVVDPETQTDVTAEPQAPQAAA